MVGLVIAAHGRLAAELVATAEQIVGRMAQVSTCGVSPGDTADVLQGVLGEAVRAVDQGEGVLVLADLLGGTPCTLSARLANAQRLAILTGVNLPMVIKANSLRMKTTSLEDLASSLTSYGQQNITYVSEARKNSATSEQPIT